MKRALLIFLILLPRLALGQDDKLPFGIHDLAIPPQQHELVVAPRTVELLSAQWSREPTASGQADLARDLGETQSLRALPALLEALKHPEAIVRAEAARSLGKLKSSQCVPALLEACKNPSPLVRREVVLAAGECGAPQVVSKGLSDADESVCLAAIARADTGDANALKDLAGGPRTRVRICAMERAAALSIPIPIELLQKSIAPESPLAVRIAAIHALQHQKAVPTQAQIDELCQTNEPELRLAAAEWVQVCGDRTQQEAWAVQLLQDGDAGTRVAGLQLARVAQSVNLLPSIRQQLESGNLLLIPFARDAIISLAEGNRAEVEKIAGDLLVSKDWRVRAEASRILGALGSSAFIEKHLLLLQDPEKRVIEVAAESLPRTHSAAAIKAVADVLSRMVDDAESLRSRDDPMPAQIATAGFVALGNVRSAAVLPACKTVITQKAVFPANVRCAAIWAFGVCANPEQSPDAISSLLTLATDPLEDEMVRLESVKALGNLRVAQAEQALRTLVETGQTHRLRWLAHWALSRISIAAPAFVDIPARVSPDLSLIDLPNAGTNHAVTLNASLVSGYVPNAWTAIRCVLANNTDQDVEGQLVITPADAPSLPRTSTSLHIPAHAQRELIVHAIFPEPPTAAELAARGSAGGVALAELVSNTGAVIARSAIAGQALSGAEDSQNAGVLLYLGGITEQAVDPYSLTREFSDALHRALVARVEATASSLDDSLGLDRVEVIVLEDLNPDSLSQSQRKTLIEFIRQGGTVVLSGVASTGNWLTAMLPVATAGQGHAVLGDDVVDYQQVLPLDPKAPRDGDSELYSEEFGRGSILLSSLRCSDLARSNDVVRLKNIAQQIHLASPSEIRPNTQHEIAAVLPAITGTPVLSWRIATGCVVGYAIAMALWLCLAGGRRRPLAFVISTVLAVVVSMVAYFIASGTRSNRQTVLARVQVLNCAASGDISEINEFAAISGTGAEVFRTNAPHGDLRMIGDRLVAPIELRPLRVDGIRAAAGQIDAVIHAKSRVETAGECTATAELHVNGLRIRVHNAMNDTIHSPVLVSNSRVYRLPDIGGDDSVLIPAQANLKDDFTNPSGIATEIDKLRAHVVKSLYHANGSGDEQSMALVGWIDHATQPLINFAPDKFDVEKEHVAVRVPVSIIRPGAGEPFVLDECLSRITFPEGGDLTAPDGQGWISTTQTGDWLICVEFPADLGAIQPRSVMLRADLLAPAHKIEWRRGLCVEGRLKNDLAGETMMTWNHVDDARELRFDCTSADFDAQGRIYLKLSVSCDRSPASAWQMRDISAEVTAVANP